MNLDKQSAQNLFAEVISIRNKSDFPLTTDQEKLLTAHCYSVADIAEKIASVCNMDANKAYVMGLLHDCGRQRDEKGENVFHGWQGYLFMQEKGYPELARISITHNFYFKDFDESTYPQCKQELKNCREYLETIEYDDYDLLLQLADMMNNQGTTCTIKQRFASIASRYNIPMAKMLSMQTKVEEIKQYFDKRCGKDIYQLLHLI